MIEQMESINRGRERECLCELTRRCVRDDDDDNVERHTDGPTDNQSSRFAFRCRAVPLLYFGTEICNVGLLWWIMCLVEARHE